MKKMAWLLMILLFSCTAQPVETAIPAYDQSMQETLHQDKQVLAVIPALIAQAEKQKIPDGQKGEYIGSLFAKSGWRLAPYIEIKSVGVRLYLVSLGYAPTTLPSSLYLFYGKDYTEIDTGDLGRINILEARYQNNELAVKYNRLPGYTRLEIKSATLTKKNSRWLVEKVQNAE